MKKSNDQRQYTKLLFLSTKNGHDDRLSFALSPLWGRKTRNVNEKRTDGQTDGWMDAQTDGWTDGRTDGWMDGQTVLS